jgi:hypothetical protein
MEDRTMRQRKVIKIDEKEITLKELTVAEILEFQDRLSGDDTSTEGFMGLVTDLLPRITQDVTVEDLKAMAPSEIEKLVDGFKEVNRPFLRGISWVGLGDLLEELKRAMVGDLLRSLSGSPAQDIPGSGNTAGVSS